MNKMPFTSCLTSVPLWMPSCTDYEVALYSEENEAEVLNRTALDYLSAGNERLNLKFDSMMVLVNNISDFIQQTEQTDMQYTVFATPDACTRSLLAQLDEYRRQKEPGETIYLSDLLIEPLVVKDTIVNVITPTLSDTIINEYHYDYRADLRRVLYKHIIKGGYDTDNILINKGNNSLNSLKYNYQMNIECSRKPASGLVGGGVKQLISSDIRNSQVKDNWNRVSTVWNDACTNNGIIHILSPQHSSSFDEFIYVFNNYGNEYKK